MPVNLRLTVACGTRDPTCEGSAVTSAEPPSTSAVPTIAEFRRTSWWAVRQCPIDFEAARASPVTDVVQPPPRGHTAADVAGAPRPGHESGRTDRVDPGDSALRVVARDALFVPKLALEIALSPVRGLVWADDRYDLGGLYDRTFFNADRTIGLFPTATYESGLGFSAGARFEDLDVFERVYAPLVVVGPPAQPLRVRCYLDESLIARLPADRAITAEMTIHGTTTRLPLALVRLKRESLPEIELSDRSPARDPQHARVVPALFRVDPPAGVELNLGELVDVRIGQRS